MGLFMLIVLGGFFLLVIALCVTSWKCDVISEEEWRDFCKRYSNNNKEKKKMSDINRTPDEYAEWYAKTYGVTIEEAKRTAAYKEFVKYREEEGFKDD